MSLSRTISKIVSVISQNLKMLCDPEYIPFRVIYHACASVPQYQSAHEI